MSTPSQPERAQFADSPVVPTGIRVASTLSWIVGVLTILLALVIGIPTLSTPGGSVLPLAINLVAGIAVCTGAVLVRQQRRLGAVLVVLAWAAPAAFAVLNHQTPRGGSFLLFAAMLFI